MSQYGKIVKDTSCNPRLKKCLNEIQIVNIISNSVILKYNAFYVTKCELLSS